MNALVTNDIDPAIELKDATFRLDERTLWSHLQATIMPGEFIAILGPNGSGKSTLLKVLLGLTALQAGGAQVLGDAPSKRNRHIGYIPQQKHFDRSLPIRGRDLVELGLTGTQFGLERSSQTTRQQVDKAIASVQATDYADMPIGLLSGGEQQRLRIAQALVGRPQLLLCDEPLLSLDIASQSIVTNLLHAYRKETNATIVFVTHEINPVLPWVDRVLYIANGHWVIDTPQQVLQTKTLSKLYGHHVEVVNLRGRLLVFGADEDAGGAHEAHHGEHL